MLRKQCEVSYPELSIDCVATDFFPDDAGNQTTRSLGLIVARGTLIVLISPADGSEEIPNPFVQAEE